MRARSDSETVVEFEVPVVGTSEVGGTRKVDGRRIAMVSDAVFPFNKGGKERALYEIAKRLVANGHQVDLYTMRWWGDSPDPSIDGIQFHAVSKLHALYNADGRRSLTQAVLFGLAMMKVIVRPFDELYVDSIPFFPLLTGRVVAWIRRKKLTTTWHEFWGPSYWKSYISGPAGVIGAGLERMASWCPDTVISVSSHTTSRLEMGSRARHIVTIPLGVDLRAIDDAAPSDEQVDVLFAGRLLTNKNVDLLVEAIALLRPEMPQIRCVIIGDGPEEQNVESRIDALDVRANVSLRPFLPTSAEIYGLMKSAGVFVLPSVREGFGLVVIEAQTCGTPVITIDHPENASRHLITPGLNGYLCTLDASDIAEKIRSVLGGECGILDRAAMRQSVEGFDWSHVATAVERVLLSGPE